MHSKVGQERCEDETNALLRIELVAQPLSYVQILINLLHFIFLDLNIFIAVRI